MSQNIEVNSSYQLDKDGLTCTLKANILASLVENAYRSKIQEIATTQRFPGFRKGKLAIPMIKQRYGPALLQDLAQEWIEKSLRNVAEKEEIEMAGSPNVEITKLVLGEDVVYEASFEMLPTFTLKELKSLKLIKPQIVLDKKDEKDVFEKVIDDNLEWESTTKPAVDSDRVTVDFKGTIDGVAFQGGTGQDSVFTLGQKQMLADFESGVKGAKAGDTVNVDCAFPDNYHAEDLRGKTAQFVIDVKKVESSKRLKLDASFLKKVNAKDQSITEYKKSLLTKKAEEIPWLEQRVLHKRVMDALALDYDFPVPASLVKQEIVEAKKNNQSPVEQDEASLTKLAERNIRLTLVVRKLVDHFQLKVDQDKVTSYLTNMTPDFIDSKTFISWYENDPQRMERVRIAVLEQQVVEKVMDESGAKIEKLSYAAAEETLKSE
ncbi:MAG: trigger factor [Pseudomonadota bacterium]|nr:trigger factor [Pseudomonadota bacterium]